MGKEKKIRGDGFLASKSDYSRGRNGEIGGGSDPNPILWRTREGKGRKVANLQRGTGGSEVQCRKNKEKKKRRKPIHIKRNEKGTSQEWGTTRYLNEYFL